jgi:hypothetical protein
LRPEHRGYYYHGPLHYCEVALAIDSRPKAESGEARSFLLARLQQEPDLKSYDRKFPGRGRCEVTPNDSLLGEASLELF